MPKALGAKLDLGAAKVELSELETSMELVETSSGLCGFVINRAVATAEAVSSFPPVSMLDGETEVAMGVDMWPDSSDQKPNTVHVCPQVSGNRADCEVLAEQLLEAKAFEYASLQKLVEMLPDVNPNRQRAINGGTSKGRRGLMAGVWAHGGFFGVAKTSKKFPATIRYINMFMREKAELQHWTSFVVLRNVKTNLHKATHIATGSVTATVTFGNFEGGELWIAKDDPDKKVFRKDAQGRRVVGENVDTKHTPYLLDPKNEHATQPWAGTRWCLSCYTSRSVKDLDADMKKSLNELGFPLPPASEIRTFGSSKVVRNTSSMNQEPRNEVDEVGSKCVRTLHVSNGSSVAHSSSARADSSSDSRRDTVRSDGQQVRCPEAKGGVCERDPHPDRLGPRGAAQARCLPEKHKSHTSSIVGDGVRPVLWTWGWMVLCMMLMAVRSFLSG